MPRVPASASLLTARETKPHHLRPVVALKQGAEPSRHAWALRLAGQPHVSLAEEALAKTGMRIQNSAADWLVTWEAAQSEAGSSRAGVERPGPRDGPACHATSSPAPVSTGDPVLSMNIVSL